MSRPHKPLPKLTREEWSRFRKRLVWRGECLECTGANINGYGTVKIAGKYYFAHRLSYMRYRRRDPGEKLVCHRCDNPSCCNPRHLFLGTGLTNMRDKVAKGRHRSNPPRGVDNYNAKLTSQKVRAIRKSPLSNRKLAAIYGVNHRVIGRIKQRQAWKHIT